MSLDIEDFNRVKDIEFVSNSFSSGLTLKERIFWPIRIYYYNFLLFFLFFLIGLTFITALYHFQLIQMTFLVSLLSIIPFSIFGLFILLFVIIAESSIDYNKFRYEIKYTVMLTNSNIIIEYYIPSPLLKSDKILSEGKAHYKNEIPINSIINIKRGINEPIIDLGYFLKMPFIRGFNTPPGTLYYPALNPQKVIRIELRKKKKVRRWLVNGRGFSLLQPKEPAKTIYLDIKPNESKGFIREVRNRMIKSGLK